LGVGQSVLAALPRAPVPDNPNAVVFSIDARSRLEGRSWSTLIRDAVAATRSFHETSGLTTYSGWAWRVALDRKNQRHLQLLLWNVFDGPATSEHLDTLERSVRAVLPGVGPGCIERVPVNGASAVLWTGGRACFPWHGGLDDAAPAAVRLSLVDGKVLADTLTRATATADDVPPELEAVLAVEAEYGDAQREDERLRLAFAMHHTQAIVAADGVVSERETTFVANLFPLDLVGSLGLDDPRVRAEYFAESRTLLKERLGHHDKLALVGLFFSACYSDGTLDAREMRVLKDAGEQLGLTKEEVVKYLRRFW
jgi:uncharacterized tellurite resistance protein B-like protein